MDIKIIDPLTKEEVKPQEVSTEEPIEVVKDSEFIVQNVASMFDLSPNEISKYEGKLDTLIRYAMTQTEDKSPEGIKWALRSLQNKVGTPPLGESWVNYLSKYAWISLENQKLSKELKKYEYH